MPYVIYSHGLAGTAVYGEADGRQDVGYVARYDPEAHGGRGDVSLTSNVDDAITFRDLETAVKFWQSVPTNRPTRPDGRPNRPLTAFSVEVIAV